jgi:2-methylisocitrate lyase-like PEP mutase family enzyme
VECSSRLDKEPTMTRSLSDKRAAFRSLHAQGCFVIPNPWDVGSARLLQHLGFAALASSSAGYAWSTGRADNTVTRDEVLEHLRQLSAAVDLPVNADFESGFAREPEALAVNVGLVVATGVSGFSIEDRRLDAPQELFDEPLAVERIRAARAELDRLGADVVLVARTERLLRDPGEVRWAIDRLVAFAEAGADCLFAPGVREPADIAAMVRAVAPRPLNVVIGRPGPSVAELAALGVRRISLGASLARAAWNGFLGAAERLREGSFDGLASGAPVDLNGIFGSFGPAR